MDAVFLTLGSLEGQKVDGPSRVKGSERTHSNKLGDIEGEKRDMGK